ncbi:g8706 [Coccomyxa elongata]
MLRKRALRLTIQGLHAALGKATQRAAVVPGLGISEDLQEPIFLDAETTEQIAATAATMRGDVLMGRRPGVLGWDATLTPTDSSKAGVTKLGPIRPITGAKDVLESPKIIQIAMEQLMDV